MPPKLKCFTKTTTKEKPPRKYTTCVGGTSKAKEEPKKKKKIKFIVKEKKATHTMPDGSVMTGATHTASSKPVKKIKFKVKKTEAPPAEKVAPKKIKFKVKAKPAPAPAKPKAKPAPPAERKNEYGLTKKEANKMDSAELFGKLPKELRQKILDPKKTGVKVGEKLFKASELDGGDLDPNNEIYGQISDNIGEGGSYNNYEGYISSSQQSFLSRMREKGNNLTDREEAKREKIEELIMTRVSNQAYKEFNAEVRKFKKIHKGQSKNGKTWEEMFDKYMNDEYF